MQNYSVYTARLTAVSYNNYITSFKAENTEAAKNKVTALHEIGGLNFNLYYYIIVEVNTGKIVWNQHEPEFKIWIKTPEAETAADLLKIFNKAHTILTASVLRADHLRRKADILKRSKHSDKRHLEIINKADQLTEAADRTESRGRKIWASITNFQGKYINWRNLTKDGQQIYSLWTSAINYDNNLKTAQKIAGITT